MASYTVELRNVCEIYGRDVVESWFKDYDLTEYLLPSQIEQLNKFNVFSKDRLARDIVDHYFMREIGYETPALFAHFARVHMRDIMQEKLPLFYTMSIDYDPLINVDFTETFNREVIGKNENQTNSNNSINSQGKNNSSKNSNDNSSHNSQINSNTTQNNEMTNTNTSSSNSTSSSNNTSTSSNNSNNSSNSSSNNVSSGFNINNDTPQKRITKQDINTGAFASNTNQSDTTTTITDETVTESEGNSTVDSTSEQNQNSDVNSSGSQNENNSSTTSSSQNDSSSNNLNETTSFNEENKTTNNTVSSSNDNSNTLEKFTRNLKGNQGISASYQAMIKQFRENIISIDKDIINELNVLFMGLY